MKKGEKTLFIIALLVIVALIIAIVFIKNSQKGIYPNYSTAPTDFFEYTQENLEPVHSDYCNIKADELLGVNFKRLYNWDCFIDSVDIIELEGKSIVSCRCFALSDKDQIKGLQ